MPQRYAITSLFMLLLSLRYKEPNEIIKLCCKKNWAKYEHKWILNEKVNGNKKGDAPISNEIKRDKDGKRYFDLSFD